MTEIVIIAVAVAVAVVVVVVVGIKVWHLDVGTTLRSGESVQANGFSTSMARLTTTMFLGFLDPQFADAVLAVSNTAFNSPFPT